MNLWSKIDKILDEKSRKKSACKKLSLWDKVSKIIESSIPQKNYPPANIGSYIKQCKAKGREDLAQLIMNQWNSLLDKLGSNPMRASWPAMTKYGSNSVKKHVFGGKDFIDWLNSQLEEELTKEEEKQIKKIKEPKIKAPKIAIPKDNETIDDWKKQEQKTQVEIKKTLSSFDEANIMIDLYKQQIIDAEKKIEMYDVGGPKHFKKDGVTPVKFFERIPKWKQQIEECKIQISQLESSVKGGKESFEDSTKGYNNAQVITVDFEKAAQESLDEMQQYLIKLVKDKNWKLIENISKDLAKDTDLKKVASFDIEAGILDKITDGFKSIGKFVMNIISWIKGFRKSVSTFHEIAYNVGR